jgi:hypothetical protein
MTWTTPKIEEVTDPAEILHLRLICSNAMKFHPIATAFPMVGKVKLEELIEDIRLNGQILPVYLFEDMVLDGRHRHIACTRLGIEPKYEEYTGDDPLGFVKSLNVHRRHLDASQRALVAAKLENVERGGRGGHLKISGDILKITREEAAAAMDVSTASVARARKVLEVGTPEQVATIEIGTLKVGTAYNKLNEDAELDARIEKHKADAAAKGNPYPSQNPPVTIFDGMAKEGKVRGRLIDAKDSLVIAKKLFEEHYDLISGDAIAEYESRLKAISDMCATFVRRSNHLKVVK